MKTIHTFLIILLGTQCVLQAQTRWEQVATPFHSPVTALSSNSHGHIIAGTYSQGVYISTDNGQSWSQRVDGLISSDMPVASLRLYDNGQVVLGSGPFGFAGSAEIYYSADNGLAWQRSRGLHPLSSVNALVADNSGTLLAAGSDTVYFSVDSGKTWTEQGLGIMDYTPQLFALAVNASDEIFAATQRGLFKSAGSSWQAVQGPWQSDTYFTTLGRRSDGLMLAGTFQGALYRSTDDGASWAVLDYPGGELPLSHIVIAPNGFLYAARESGALYRSIDNGENWYAWSEGLPGAGTVLASTIVPDGRAYLGVANADAPLYRSTGLLTDAAPRPNETQEPARILSIAPNPAERLLKVTLAGFSDRDVLLRVYNLRGDILYKGRAQLHAQAENSLLYWDSAALAPGAYMLEIGSAAATARAGFIKR